MEKGSVIDSEQTYLEWNPVVMTATMASGMLITYLDYMKTHEFAERNRRITMAFEKMRRNHRFYVPYHR